MRKIIGFMATPHVAVIDRTPALQKTNPPLASQAHPASGRAVPLGLRKAFAGASDVDKRQKIAVSMTLSRSRGLRVPLAGIIELVTCAAIALAPQASATGQDDDFLALLAQAGVPAHDNIPSVIDYGHKVCEALDGGESASSVIDTMANYGYAEDPSHDLGQYHRTMVRFVGVSVRAFCPGNEGKLASFSGSKGHHRIVFSGLLIPNPPQIPPQPEPAIKLVAPPVATPSPAPPPKQVPPPPPQVVRPPAARPEEGAGGEGTGGGVNGGGGSSSGGVPAQPAPQLPEGHIVLAP